MDENRGEINDDKSVAPPSLDGETKDSAKVVFKKRSIKGQIRGALSSSASMTTAIINICNESKGRDGDNRTNQEDDDDKGIDNRSLKDIKLEQQLRRRQIGVDAESIVKASAALAMAAKIKPATKDAVGIGSAMGTQFSSRGETIGPSSSINPHEKIMQSYVDEKLGLETSSEARAQDVLTEDDKLYKVPAAIKALDGTLASRQEDDMPILASNVEAGLYSGIAEVALPSSFKKRNLEETEAALRAMGRAPHGTQYGQSQPGYRLMQNQKHGLGGGSRDGGGSVASSHPQGTKRPQHDQAHDNFVMQQFKKRNMR